MKRLWSIALGLAPMATGTAFSAPAAAQCQSLTTQYASNNGGSAGGQIFFDVVVLNFGGINVVSLDTNTSAAIGSPINLDVYTIATGYAGNETNMAAWTLVSTGSGTSAGTNQPTAVDVADFSLAAGSYGVALIISGGAHRYTGVGSGPPALMYSNVDLTVMEGAALNVPWTGTPFQPRMWNGSVYYNCSTGPTSYCTSGASTAGCVPAISAAAQPSITLANACSLAVANVDGLRSGIVFYGVNGAAATPWATGSTSLLCVKSPTQRTGVQTSGGTLGLCDGALTLDWNAWQTSHATALGSPWAVGMRANVQAWINDPSAPKKGVTSNAVELTYQP